MVNDQYHVEINKIFCGNAGKSINLIYYHSYDNNNYYYYIQILLLKSADFAMVVLPSSCPFSCLSICVMMIQ